jgi:hypothetical protein
MQISKVPIIASLAAAIALQLHGQPASPELQNKALDLLRQTISQQPQRPAEPVTRVTPSAPKPATLDLPKPAPTAPEMAAMPQVNRPASSESQERAIQVLRAKMAQENAAAAAMQPKPSQGTAIKKPVSTKAGAPANRAPAGVQSRGTTTPVPTPAPAPPEQATGPKTKQQRLIELLDRYKADKLTPPEYQAERAKILAEP